MTPKLAKYEGFQGVGKVKRSLLMNKISFDARNGFINIAVIKFLSISIGLIYSPNILAQEWRFIASLECEVTEFTESPDKLNHRKSDSDENVGTLTIAIVRKGTVAKYIFNICLEKHA